MNGTEIIRLENHIRELAADINSNYPEAISDSKVEDLVTKYMSLECSYDEAVKIVDEEMANILVDKVDPDEAEKKFIDSMVELYDKQHNVANPDKIFGDTLNIHLVELYNLYDVTDNLDFSLEGKILYFNRIRNELIEKYNVVNKPFSDYLRKISFEDVKVLFDTFIKYVDIVNDDIDSSMESTIKRGVNLFNSDGTINRDAYDFEELIKVYDFALKHNKQIKLSNLLVGNVFPKSLNKALDGKSSEEQRSMVILFLEDYLNNIAMIASEKGYQFRQIDVVNNIIEDFDSSLLRNTPWREYLGDRYYIDFIKMVRKIFPDTELVLCEDNEFLPGKSDKIKTIIDSIKEEEKRSGIKLIDAIGLKSHYFDWNKDIGKAISANDIYESMYKIFGLGLPIYRTEYDFNTTMKDDNVKNELLHAIRLTDQYCDISGVILGSNKTHLLRDNMEPSDDYVYYAEEYSNSRKNNVTDNKSEDEEMSRTMILKLLQDQDAPSGYVLSNSLLVLVILIFAFLVIVASILLN